MISAITVPAPEHVAIPIVAALIGAQPAIIATANSMATKPVTIAMISSVSLSCFLGRPFRAKK
jgi:hypothetical protein